MKINLKKLGKEGLGFYGQRREVVTRRPERLESHSSDNQSNKFQKSQIEQNQMQLTTRQADPKIVGNHLLDNKWLPHGAANKWLLNGSE